MLEMTPRYEYVVFDKPFEAVRPRPIHQFIECRIAAIFATRLRTTEPNVVDQNGDVGVFGQAKRNLLKFGTKRAISLALKGVTARIVAVKPKGYVTRKGGKQPWEYGFRRAVHDSYVGAAFKALLGLPVRVGLRAHGGRGCARGTPAPV